MHVCAHVHTHTQLQNSTQRRAVLDEVKRRWRACVQELGLLGCFMSISGGALQKPVSFFGLWISLVFISSSWELETLSFLCYFSTFSLYLYLIATVLMYRLHLNLWPYFQDHGMEFFGDLSHKADTFRLDILWAGQITSGSSVFSFVDINHCLFWI